MSLIDNIYKLYNNKTEDYNLASKALALFKAQGKIEKISVVDDQIIVNYESVSDLSCMTSPLFQKCGLYVHCYDDFRSPRIIIHFRDKDIVYE